MFWCIAGTCLLLGLWYVYHAAQFGRGTGVILLGDGDSDDDEIDNRVSAVLDALPLPLRCLPLLHCQSEDWPTTHLSSWWEILFSELPALSAKHHSVHGSLHDTCNSAVWELCCIALLCLNLR